MGGGDTFTLFFLLFPSLFSGRQSAFYHCIMTKMSPLGGYQGSISCDAVFGEHGVIETPRYAVLLQLARWLWE